MSDELHLIIQRQQRQINDLQEKMLRLFNQVNEFDRRLNNIIIPGTVKSLSADNKSIIVKHGSCETPEIKWFCKAGEVIEYRAPSVDEQCLLLNLTGGTDTSKCVALVGITSDKFSFDEANPNRLYLKYPDGSLFSFDFENHIYNIEMPAGTANIIVPEKITFQTTEMHVKGKLLVDENIRCLKSISASGHVSDGTSSMQDMRVTYNGHKHNNKVPTPIITEQMR